MQASNIHVKIQIIYFISLKESQGYSSILMPPKPDNHLLEWNKRYLDFVLFFHIPMASALLDSVHLEVSELQVSFLSNIVFYPCYWAQRNLICSSNFAWSWKALMWMLTNPSDGENYTPTFILANIIIFFPQ